mmetsp:Transcript_89149/g.236911  ORF Transcript_89149/g.236911 Transcript_89149/m.236911 type:complete len:251 (-) Transcript_89149:319-1071(-)
MGNSGCKESACKRILQVHGGLGAPPFMPSPIQESAPGIVQPPLPIFPSMAPLPLTSPLPPGTMESPAGAASPWGKPPAGPPSASGALFGIAPAGCNTRGGRPGRPPICSGGKVPIPGSGPIGGSPGRPACGKPGCRGPQDCPSAGAVAGPRCPAGPEPGCGMVWPGMKAGGGLIIGGLSCSGPPKTMAKVPVEPSTWKACPRSWRCASEASTRSPNCMTPTSRAPSRLICTDWTDPHLWKVSRRSASASW